MRFPLGFLSLLVSSSLSPAQSGALLYRFDGSSTYEGFGGAVAGCGDVDLDGHADVIVGADSYSSGGTIRVFSGRTGAVIHTFGISGRGDAVAGAGDVNADGYPDLLVGDWGTGAGAGAAWVFSGRTGAQLHRWDGVGGDDYMGGDVNAAGDVNGDGYDDVIVGAWGESATIAFSGAAYVYSGLDGSVLHKLSGTFDHGYLGHGVAGLGDVNGDSVPDVAVGAFGESSLGYNTGALHVYSGSDGSILWSKSGPSQNSRFGEHVRAGDVNGDGVRDVIVGAMFEEPNGHVYVFSGVDGAPLLDLWSQNPDEVFGDGLDFGGDVNGDGAGDVVVSSDRYYQPGGYTGWAYAYSGSTGERLQYIREGGPTDRLGKRIAGAGDVNLDGYDDILVSAHEAQPGGVLKAGSAFLISGNREGVLYSLSNLQAGQNVTLAVSGCAPFASVIVGYSLTGAGPTSTIYGLVDMSLPITALPPLTCDGSGVATSSLAVPAPAAGAVVYTQAAELLPVGANLSNSLAWRVF